MVHSAGDGALGFVSTIAGSGVSGFVDGIGISASFNAPAGIAVVNQTLYVSDTGNHCIRRIRLASRVVETLAGKEVRIVGSPIIVVCLHMKLE